MHGSYLCTWVTQKKGPHAIKWSPSPKLTPDSLSYALQRALILDARENPHLMELLSEMSPKRSNRTWEHSGCLSVLSSCLQRGYQTGIDHSGCFMPGFWKPWEEQIKISLALSRGENGQWTLTGMSYVLLAINPFREWGSQTVTLEKHEEVTRLHNDMFSYFPFIMNIYPALKSLMQTLIFCSAPLCFFKISILSSVGIRMRVNYCAVQFYCGSFLC